MARGGIRAVAYAVPGENRWVDTRGHEVVDPPGASRSSTSPTGPGPAVRLVLARSGGLVGGGLSSATRLALANARLAAVGRARLDPGAGIPAADRRHPGRRAPAHRAGPARRRAATTGQRRVPPPAGHAHAGPRWPTSCRAETEVHEALHRLRALAHGVFPAVLADEGLRPALEDLVAAADRRVGLDFRVRDDVPEDAAMAVYATLARCCRGSPATAGVDVAVGRDADTLRVQEAVDGGTLDPASPSLGGAADRIGALGGRFSLGRTAATLWR